MERLFKLLKLKQEGSLTYMQSLELRDLLREELKEVKKLERQKWKQKQQLKEPEKWSGGSSTATCYTSMKK